METEKQKFLLDCIDISNKIKDNCFEKYLSAVQLWITSHALQGKTSAYFLKTVVNLYGQAIDEQGIKLIVDHLKKDGFEIIIDPPGFNGYYLVSWSNL